MPSAQQAISNKIVKSISLFVLKECRAKMIEDFLNHQPEIYAPSYKYEDSPALLRLAREKYFHIWLARHWQVFSDIVKDYPETERKTAELFFSKALLILMSKWVDIESTESSQLHVALQLIKEMQRSLQKFIEAGENHDVMRRKLQVAMEKNNRLLEREIINFGGGKI